MKKTLVIIIFTLIVIMFIGCKQNEATSINNNISSNQGTTNQGSSNNSTQQKQVDNTTYQWKSDEYYLDKYITSLDICLINHYELLFNNGTEIRNDTLYAFFVYIVDKEKIYNYKDWFDKKDNMYHIPASIVEPTVKKYLNINSINISELDHYDKNSNEIVVQIFAGFGGMNFPKILNKEYLGNNIIRLTAGFYDEKYKTLLYKKVFTIEENPQNEKEYKYLSIVKIVNINGKEVEKSSPD